jgi:hypothetical protein
MILQTFTKDYKSVTLFHSLSQARDPQIQPRCYFVAWRARLRRLGLLAPIRPGAKGPSIERDWARSPAAGDCDLLALHVRHCSQDPTPAHCWPITERQQQIGTGSCGPTGKPSLTSALAVLPHRAKNPLGRDLLPGQVPAQAIRLHIFSLAGIKSTFSRNLHIFPANFQVCPLEDIFSTVLEFIITALFCSVVHGPGNSATFAIWPLHCNGKGHIYPISWHWWHVQWFE